MFASLHIQTMFWAIIAVSLVQAVPVAVIGRSGRQPGLRIWAMALGMAAAAYVLLLLRGSIPDYASVIAAYTLISAFYALLLLSVLVFFGDPIDWPTLLLPPIMLALTYSVLLGSLHHRILAGNLIYLAQAGVILLHLGRRRAGISRRGRNLVLFGVGLFVLSMLWRIGAVVLWPEAFASLFQSSDYAAIIYSLIFAALILTTNGFVLMALDRTDAPP